jgi:uncharacterized surface protein with fasciclin (FAS1) repeats
MLANPNFTSLVGALTGAGQPDFVTILSGTGPFTVFPTNAAFTALNTELAPGGIASVSAANLTKVLQYHVVSEYSSCYFNRRSNCHYVKHSNVYSSISRRS